MNNTARLQQLMAFLADSPNEPFLLFAIAKEHEGIGNEEQTLFYYEKLVTEHVNYVGTYYHLGKFYERQERIEAAIEVYTKGMKIAETLKEMHALGELRTAKMLIDDDDF